MVNIILNKYARTKGIIGPIFTSILFASLVTGQIKPDGAPLTAAVSDSGIPIAAGLLTEDQTASNPGPESSVDIQSKIVDLLFERNREIRAAEKAAQAAQERIKTQGVLPDPKIESSLFLEPIETRNGPMEGQFMLGQKFPLWGKLRRQRQVAIVKAEIAALKLQQKKVSVVFQMRKAWENNLKISRSLEILNNYREELESFKSIALTQYSTGTGLTQHPILKLQIEIALVESKINTLQSSLESVTNTLQSLYDGSYSPDLFGGQRTSLLPAHPSEIWLGQAKQVNPLYQIAQSERQISVLENELAVRKNAPDLVTGLTYTTIGDAGIDMAPSNGADAMGVKIGLNIPLWFGRNKARVQATKYMINSREENLAAVWNRIEDAVKSTNKDLDEIEQTYNLYNEQLLQESGQMLSSAFAAYETGKISFLDLLDSERMVVQVKLEFEAVEARRRIASGRLLKEIGIINWDEE